MKTRDPYFSRAVEKAMVALECIRKSEEPLSLVDVSAILKLTKASAFRLLYTLEATHYLCKTPDGRYFAPARSNHQEMVRQGA